MTLATHEVLVTLHDGVRVIFEGERVAYDGPPDWKRRPLDPASLKRWEKATANPDRVSYERSIQPRSTRGLTE